MPMTLQELNVLVATDRATLLATCCGAAKWVEKMNGIFPVDDEAGLLQQAELCWNQCGPEDWVEAFQHHPKIGDINSLKEKYAATRTWAEGEQAAVQQTSPEVLQALADGNQLYEKKFGYIFIVCATGKSAVEMLGLLRARLENNKEDEIHIAMQEQARITALRLKKILAT